MQKTPKKYRMDSWDKWEQKSSFWTDNYDYNVSADIIQLYGLQRAISNFVRIVTNKAIPVKFTPTGRSYTNGSTVYISGTVKPTELDAAIGLALHEGSHIAITNFTSLSTVYRATSRPVVEVLLQAKNIYEYEYTNWLKDIVNIIEDRRIDMYQFKQAPGYKSYYHALYDKYFNDPIIDLALETYQHSEGKVDDYIFHLCNMTNPKRTLDALPGLRSIYNKIDLANIDRLKSTDEVVELSIEILNEIISHIDPKTKTTTEPEPGQGEPSNSSGGDQNEGQDDDSADVNGDDSADDADDEEDNNSGNGAGNSGDGEEDNDNNDDWDSGSKMSPTVELSPKQKRQLEKAQEAQKKFLKGEIDKKKVSKHTASQIEEMEQAGVEIAEANYNGQKVSVGVLKNIPLAKIKDSVGESIVHCFGKKPMGYISAADVATALNRGCILGRKLQIRNDERTLVSTRQKHGKIDGRMLAEAGFGNGNIFKSIITENFIPAHVHISIDASGSMNSGQKWQNANLCALMLAKAFSMLKGVNVVIDYRYTSNHDAMVAVIYDSRKETPALLGEKMMYGRCPGSTPEGLCFDAIQDIIQSGNNKLRSYFINISDGMPEFSGKDASGRRIEYRGTNAFKHVRKQINKMRDRNINVLSYFVYRAGQISGNPEQHHIYQSFKEMYGDSAKILDAENITAIAKDITNLLMSDKVVY